MPILAKGELLINARDIRYMVGVEMGIFFGMCLFFCSENKRRNAYGNRTVTIIQ